MAIRLATLSSRQLECLKLVANGKTAAEVGSYLGLSPRTVYQHLDEAKGRLDAVTLAEAVANAKSIGAI